ncbi:MAG TPA: mannosyltransferase family protein [Ktedonobacterales bacterium]|nr:mannosyltransferase family protein [Ktedonobacterales bacterium]
MPQRDEWRQRAAVWVRALLAAPKADAAPAPAPETPQAARAGARQVMAVFAATRAALLVATYVGYVLVQAPQYSVGSVDGLFTSWDRWDALRYLSIATHGYTTPAETAFFPLYPLLIHILTLPFGGQGGYVVGLLVANAAFLGALLLLRALVAAQWGGAVALRAVTLLAVFPGALYTFAPYNESQFLLCSIGCVLALRRRRWAVAGALGGLAALTRAAGLLLLLPFAYEWWRAWRAGAWGKGAAPWQAAAWALAIPAGMALFAAYCAARFGDALAFAHAQAQWNRVLTWPWVGLWWQLQGLAQAAPASFFQAHDLLDLGATVLLAALLVVGWRRLPRAESLYLAALVLLVISEPGGVRTHLHDPLTSNTRFAIEMFPGFTTLALLTARRPAWYQAIVAGSAALMAVLAVIFALGRWLV